MAFTGIPIAALDFYEDLEADNSKAFWPAHKHIYDESVRAPLEALVAELEPEFGPAKLFRPVPRRAVREGQDAVQDPAGRLVRPVVDLRGGVGRGVVRRRRLLADRLRPGGPVAAGGRRRRRRPAADRAVAAVEKARFELGGEQVTRVPNGYPKDHPRGDLLRYKSMTAHRQFGAPAWLSTKRAKTEIVKAWRAMDPLTTGWTRTSAGTDRATSGLGWRRCSLSPCSPAAAAVRRRHRRPGPDAATGSAQSSARDRWEFFSPRPAPTPQQPSAGSLSVAAVPEPGAASRANLVRRSRPRAIPRARSQSRPRPRRSTPRTRPG